MFLFKKSNLFHLSSCAFFFSFLKCNVHIFFLFYRHLSLYFIKGIEYCKYTWPWEVSFTYKSAIQNFLEIMFYHGYAGFLLIYPLVFCALKYNTISLPASMIDQHFGPWVFISLYPHCNAVCVSWSEETHIASI